MTAMIMMDVDATKTACLTDDPFFADQKSIWLQSGGILRLHCPSVPSSAPPLALVAQDRTFQVRSLVPIAAPETRCLFGSGVDLGLPLPRQPSRRIIVIIVIVSPLTL